MKPKMLFLLVLACGDMLYSVGSSEPREQSAASPADVRWVPYRRLRL